MHDTSEDMAQSAINPKNSHKLNLWLDGHFSAGTKSAGETGITIAQDLDLVGNHQHPIENVAVFVSDIRCLTHGEYCRSNNPPRGAIPGSTVSTKPNRE